MPNGNIFDLLSEKFSIYISVIIDPFSNNLEMINFTIDLLVQSDFLNDEANHIHE